MLLRKFTGKPHAFVAFAVPSDTLYYEYTFDERDPPCFGVRFTVSRLTGLWLEVECVLLLLLLLLLLLILSLSLSLLLLCGLMCPVFRAFRRRKC